MESTISTKNMVSIPKRIASHYGLKPGWKLDWEPGKQPDEIVVRVVPDRAEKARRLLGKGKNLSPDTDSVSELIAERLFDG